MSKELIVRLREAAAQRVASTAMIGADDLSAAADALEISTAGMNAYCDELGSCRKAAGFGSADDPMAQEGFDAFGDPLCVAAFVESQFKRVAAERDALAAELKAVRGDQTPATDDINLQEWKGMDGACAWHLIGRYAEDWHHTARLMNAWLEANREDLVAQVAQLSAAIRDAFEFAYQAQKELKALREQEPSCWTTYPPSGRYSKCKAEVDLWERNNWTIVPLYAHPVPGREMTDADIALCIASADKSFAQERISGKPVLGVWSKHLARAIERYLKGESE